MTRLSHTETPEAQIANGTKTTYQGHPVKVRSSKFNVFTGRYDYHVEFIGANRTARGVDSKELGITFA